MLQILEYKKEKSAAETAESEQKMAESNRKQEKRHFQGFRRLPYKAVICLGLLGLVSILVLVFASYTYYDYQKECQTAAGKEAEYTAARLVNQVDERLNYLREYYVTYLDEEDIRWVLENNLEYSDYSRYKKARDVMASENLFGDYTSGFTFVNFRTEWVLSNKGMYPMEETYNREALEELFQRKNNAFDKNYWCYDANITIDNTVDRKYRVTVETGGLSLVIKLPMYSLNVYGMFIVNLNMNTWQSWMEQWIDDYEQVVVIDPEGNVIYAPDEKLAEAGLMLHDSGKAGEDANPEILKWGGHSSYAAASRVSGILNWEYYVFHDMDAAQQQTGMRFPAEIFFLMLSLIAVCFLCVFYVIYRPIGRLVQNVSEEPLKVQGNELDYLARSFANLKDDKEALERVLELQKDKLKELFELRLIRGEVRSSDELDEYFKELNLSVCKYFSTAVIVLNLKGENDTQSNVNEDAICLELLESIPDNIKDLTWMPPVYNACTIFALFGDQDEGRMLKKIMDFYEGIQQFAESRFGFRILMGVSTTHTDYRHIRGAYRESINALTMQRHSLEPEERTEGEAPAEENGSSEGTIERSISLGQEDCHFYLSSTTIHGSEYNRGFEKDIQTAVKGVDKEQCYHVTDDFSVYLCSVSSSYEEMVYVLRFVNTVLLTAIDARVDLDKLYPEGLKKFYFELLEVMEPSRVRRYMKARLIDPVIRARTELLENSSYSMMEEIERKIAEAHGNITLTECADALGVHSTYIWKILKMEKGKSFSDYLEEYKIEEAKRLLLQTGMTVAEIATELNYTNAQNFIRFFSKSTGVTPGKFRKLY